MRKRYMLELSMLPHLNAFGFHLVHIWVILGYVCDLRKRWKKGKRKSEKGKEISNERNLTMKILKKNNYRKLKNTWTTRRYLREP